MLCAPAEFTPHSRATDAASAAEESKFEGLAWFMLSSQRLRFMAQAGSAVRRSEMSSPGQYKIHLPAAARYESFQWGFPAPIMNKMTEKWGLPPWQPPFIHEFLMPQKARRVVVCRPLSPQERGPDPPVPPDIPQDRGHSIWTNHGLLVGAAVLRHQILVECCIWGTIPREEPRSQLPARAILSCHKLYARRVVVADRVCKDRFFRPRR